MLEIINEIHVMKAYTLKPNARPWRLTDKLEVVGTVWSGEKAGRGVDFSFSAQGFFLCQDMPYQLRPMLVQCSEEIMDSNM